MSSYGTNCSNWKVVNIHWPMARWLLFPQMSLFYTSCIKTFSLYSRSVSVTAVGSWEFSLQNWKWNVYWLYLVPKRLQTWIFTSGTNLHLWLLNLLFVLHFLCSLYMKMSFCQLGSLGKQSLKVLFGFREESWWMLVFCGSICSGTLQYLELEVCWRFRWLTRLQFKFVIF